MSRDHDPDAPQKASFARELLTLRVRTIYASADRLDLNERSNRLRLFALSRVYADYLDSLAGEVTRRDLYGGRTTFCELRDQARQLRTARLDAPERHKNTAEIDILGRIERTSHRIVQEIFDTRRRAFLLRESLPEDAPLEPTRTATPAGVAPLTSDSVATGRSKVPAPADLEGEEEEDDDGLVQPLMLVEFGDEIAEHDDPAHDLVLPDPEWLRKLIRANLHWDNELFSDGSTQLIGVPTDVLPDALRERRRYPELELPYRVELELVAALDVGTDLVALQSSLSLSGDVITRVSPHLPAEDRELFLALHRDGTTSALSYWTQLIQALRAFLNGLFDTAFGRGDDR